MLKQLSLELFFLCKVHPTLVDMDVSMVAMKLPTFWSAQPTTWFIQAEAQFELRNITTDSTKYCHVIVALGQATALHITDVIQNPPQDGKYNALKKQLCQTLELQETKHAECLLSLASMGLGDWLHAYATDGTNITASQHKTFLLSLQADCGLKDIFYFVLLTDLHVYKKSLCDAVDWPLLCVMSIHQCETTNGAVTEVWQLAQLAFLLTSTMIASMYAPPLHSSSTAESQLYCMILHKSWTDKLSWLCFRDSLSPSLTVILFFYFVLSHHVICSVDTSTCRSLCLFY